MKQILKWAGIGLGGLIVILLIIGIFAPESEEEPQITVSAYELLRDYEDNEVAADLKYKGKVVLVTGVIIFISANSGISTVAFNTPGMLMKEIESGNTPGVAAVQLVTCKFGRDGVASVAKLSKGQQITFKGKVTGEGMFGVEVNRCSLWESP